MGDGGNSKAPSAPPNAKTAFNSIGTWLFSDRVPLKIVLWSQDVFGKVIKEYLLLINL